MVSKLLQQEQNKIQIFLLITAWLLGNIWTYQWFAESLFSSSIINLTLFSLVLIFLGWRLVYSEFWQNPQQNSAQNLNLHFQLRLNPALLMVGAEIGAIFLKWSLNIPQLTLLCFILGSYGLVGLFIPASTWRQGLSIATIVACVIPFLVAFNSGLGFPVRVITAHAVARVLSDFQLAAASSHDIILMENGIAQVDLPCSGMKSLWTGTIFLLGVTWLEKRQLGFRWLLVAIANGLLLIGANMMRVLLLVFAIEVLQQQELAHILHVPLGMIGFAGASLLTWILLQTVPKHQEITLKLQPERPSKFSSKFSLKLSWLLVLIITLGIVGQLRPLSSSAVDLESLSLPPEIATETLALSPAEVNFFDNLAHPLVQKLRFNYGELSGSMLMVASDTWQAHHPPELCFTGNGLKVDQMTSQQIAGINARWLSLQNGELAATYWFQSAQGTTDDFISRIWEHLRQKDQTWVLVSVLFDEAEQSSSPAVQDFSRTIYQTINHSLS